MSPGRRNIRAEPPFCHIQWSCIKPRYKKIWENYQHFAPYPSYPKDERPQFSDCVDPLLKMTNQSLKSLNIYRYTYKSWRGTTEGGVEEASPPRGNELHKKIYVVVPDKQQKNTTVVYSTCHTALPLANNFHSGKKRNWDTVPCAIRHIKCEIVIGESLNSVYVPIMAGRVPVWSPAYAYRSITMWYLFVDVVFVGRRPWCHVGGRRHMNRGRRGIGIRFPAQSDTSNVK